MPEERGRSEYKAAELRARAAEIQGALAALQARLSELEGAAASIEAGIASLLKAGDSINAIVSGKGGEFLFPLDEGGNALARVTGVDSDKFIVHVGLEYYAEVDPATALTILAERRARLEQRLKAVRDEAARTVEAIRQLQAELERLAAALRQAQG